MRGVDLSISQRLALGFGTILALLVVLLGAATLQDRQVAAQHDRLDTVIAPRARAAANLQTAYLSQAIALRSYALSADETALQSYRQKYAQGRNEVAVLRQLIKDPDGQAIFDELAPLTEQYDRAAEGLIAAVQQKAGAASMRAAEVALSDTRSKLFDRTRAYLDLQAEKDQAALSALQQEQQAGLLTRSILAVLMLIACAVAALVTVRSIRVPVHRLTAAARALRQGDYGPALSFSQPERGRQPDAAAPRDELRELARTFGQMAGVVQHRELRLAARNRISAALATNVEVDQLTSQALDEVVTYAAAAFGAVYVLDTETAALHRAAAYAMGDAELTVPLGTGLPGQAAAGRRSIVVSDIPGDTPFRIHFGIEELPPRAIMAVPILFREKVIGALLVGSIRDLSADAIGFVEQTAVQLGVSLQNALAHRQVVQLAADLQDKNELLALQNEELQAQNEEIQAQSEEIQAQSEEIQAQSEELLSQNEELSRSQAILQEADTLKNEFLSIAAHELKTPMTSLKGFTQLLLREAPKEPALQRFSRFLDHINRQTDILAERIGRLLNLSRAQMGLLQVSPEPADLVALVRQQVQQAQVRARGHRIVLETEVPELAGSWDAFQLEQAIGNLLDNAIRYSPDADEIGVTVRADGGHAEIAIRDAGIGIPAEAIPQLFQPYFRHDSAREITADGMGIGLYLSQQIITAHGGEIRVESQVGAGATFTIVLPVPLAPPDQDGDPLAEANVTHA